MVLSREDDMKRLDIIIPHEFLPDVNGILHKHNVGGMSFYDVKGRGRAKPDKVTVGRGLSTYVPEFSYRTKIEVVIRDDMVDKVIADLRGLFEKGPAAIGKIFVYNVIDVYDISTKQRGEQAL